MRNVSENQPSHTNHFHNLQLLDTFLRLSVIPLSAASIWLTVTNKQDNDSYGRLEFSNLAGLKYMICINAISAGYALVSVVASWLRCLLSKAWAFFVSDQVVTYLMVTSGAAVLEILYLAYNGDNTVTWSEACVSYGRFCSRLQVALILQAIALFFYFLLSLISSYKVFSKFEPPIASKEMVEESD